MVDLKGLVFLVVDDYPPDRYRIADALIARNASVLLADSYESCLAFLEKGAVFDLLILDIELRDPRAWDKDFDDYEVKLELLRDEPQHTGFEVLDHIRNHSLPVRVVVWSSHLKNLAYVTRLAPYGVGSMMRKPRQLWEQPGEVFEPFDEADFIMLGALARNGRYVCDAYNSDEIKRSETYAHGQIEHLLTRLSGLLGSASQSEKKAARDLLTTMGKIRVAARDNTENSFSWKFVVQELRKFMTDVAPATVAELIRRFLL